MWDFLSVWRKDSPPQARVETDERFQMMMNAMNKTAFLWAHAPHVVQTQLKRFLTAGTLIMLIKIIPTYVTLMSICSNTSFTYTNITVPNRVFCCHAFTYPKSGPNKHIFNTTITT